MNDTSPARLRMSRIGKSFGPATVLHDVDLELMPGEVHGLVGQNGAGKSTLMKVLGGVYPDHSGTVEIDGTLHRLASPRAALAAGVAVIYQELSLIPSMTVAENITLGIEPGSVRYTPGAVVQSAQDVIRRSSALSGLPLLAQVSELGAGTQQMVEIAKSLARDARILVLDEPTARLSGPERDALHGLIRELSAQGTAIVYISHFLDEVLEHTDRITVLRNGRVVEERESKSFTRDSLVQSLLSRELLEDEFASRAIPTRSELSALQATAITGIGFEEVHLDVRVGEIVGIAGLVGSGRTRLARALAGAAKVNAGTLEVGSRTRRFRSPRQAAEAGVVLVPEDRKSDGIIASATAEENLTLRALDGRLATGGLVRGRRSRRVARDAMASLQVHPARLDQPGDGFSGGNQQKLLIGRALLAEPKVLVIDQPTAGVDVGAKAQIHDLLRVAAADGTAIIVISDDIDELLALSHRVAVMSHGRVTDVGGRDEITHDELVQMISAA